MNLKINSVVMFGFPKIPLSVSKHLIIYPRLSNSATNPSATYACYKAAKYISLHKNADMFTIMQILSN